MRPLGFEYSANNGISATIDRATVERLVREALSTSPYRYQARIEIHAPLAAVAERVPATVATLEATPAGTTVLVTGADDLDLIAFHVARLGLPITILEPAELAERAAELGRRLLDAVE